MQNLTKPFDMLAYLAEASAQLITVPGITVSGGPGSDTFIGLSGDDRYFGAGGADFIFGGGGADRLYGGGGNDLMVGGAGNDLIAGGSGTDTISYSGTVISGPAGGVNSGVVVRLDLGTTTGAAGSDTISGFENAVGSAGADRIVGTALNNLLIGADGDDLLFGGASYDSLVGMNGVDRLFGDVGNDILGGGAGNDFVVGGAGSDLLFGGAGADQFFFGVLSDKGGTDQITGFEVGLDKLVISQLPGGSPSSLPTIVFETGLGGVTNVSVALAGVALFDINVLTTGGTISQSDVVFSFNG